VVALGPWSSDILRRSATCAPAFERGYHREYTPNPARVLQRPIHDSDGAFLMTPMEKRFVSLRASELTDRDGRRPFAQSTPWSDGAVASSNLAPPSATPGAGRGRRCRTACR